MKVKEIAVTIRQTINCGNYESISPSLSLSATLDEDDDEGSCLSDLHKIASAEWARQALVELSWVRARRKDDTHEFNSITKGTKDQLKSLL